MTCEDIRPGILPSVDWKVIRSAFIREREKLRRKDGEKVTQKNVADAAGLHQSDISKLEANDHKGPLAENFVRAIEGLGMPVSEFFRRIEGLPASVPMRDDQSLPTAKASQADEALSPLTAEERRTIRALTKVININADRETESKRPTHRRHAPDPDDRKAKARLQSGRNRPRHAQRRLKHKR